MGQQCSLHENENSRLHEIENQLSISHQCKTGDSFNYFEEIDDSDTPILRPIKCLNNKQPILASNHLLEMNNLKRSTRVRLKASSKSKSSKKRSQKKASQKSLKKSGLQKRCSIERIMPQFSGNSGNWTHMFNLPGFPLQDPLQDPKTQQAMQSFKTYITSDKSLYHEYNAVEIKLQDFIKLKKSPIRKHYLFNERIGEGSYGHVYRATCMRSNEVRAIKSIKQKIMPTEKKNEFISEMEILRDLDHPNIIKLYEIYEDNSNYHVVTEYCSGGSIIDFVLSRKKYSEKVIRCIFLQIVTAVNYMHNSQIVHRDLKLENVVFLKKITEDTKLGAIDIKIIDFGTASRIKALGEMSPSNGLIGTTSYMAPEIIEGCFNERCDIWSIGVVLYVMLVGKSPFKCAKKEETLRKIQSHELTFEDPEWKNISREAKDLLSKMLTKDPGARLSAAEVLGHRWFREIKSGKNLIFENRSLVDNLSKYYRGNNFISKIESYLTLVKVSQEERKRISEMFGKLDINKDGTIEVEELRVAYDSFGDLESLEELEYIVSKIDKNKSGKIDLSEFTAAIYDRKKLFVKEYLQEAFNYFDSDSTGFIERHELTDLLEGCQKAEIEEILREIDQNGDDRISSDEFLDYMMKRNFLFEKEGDPRLSTKKSARGDLKSSKHKSSIHVRKSRVG